MAEQNLSPEVIDVLKDAIALQRDTLEHMVAINKQNFEKISEIQKINYENMERQRQANEQENDKYIERQARSETKLLNISFCIVTIVCITAIVSVLTFGMVMNKSIQEYFNYTPAEISNTNNNTNINGNSNAKGGEN